MSAGQPAFFRCAKCRREPFADRGGLDRVVLNGKYKPFREVLGKLGTQTKAWSIAYSCQDCGHYGWSAHEDIIARFEREFRVELSWVPPDGVRGPQVAQPR